MPHAHRSRTRTMPCSDADRVGEKQGAGRSARDADGSGRGAGAGVRRGVIFNKCTSYNRYAQALAPNIQVTATRLRGVILRTATWPHEVDALGQSVPGAVALCRGCAVTSREMMPMGRICVSAPRGSLGPLSYLLRVPCFGRPSVPCQKSSSASRRRADWSGFI